jgi:mannitol 2-dehydrogenase
VVCEPWLQWVIEDRFRGGRPAWERHGVQLVPDVTPYEDAKLRLLNGAHQMLSFPALLAGFEQVHDAVADPALGDYLRRFMSEDAIPGLASTPGLDLAGYAATLMRRFANAAIADRVERLCQDAGGKLPVYIRPTLTSSLRSGRDGRRLAFMLACFDRYLRVRRDDRGNELVVRDANAMHLLRPVMASDSPLTLLHQVDLVGPEAAGDRAFVAQYLSPWWTRWSGGARSERSGGSTRERPEPATAPDYSTSTSGVEPEPERLLDLVVRALGEPNESSSWPLAPPWFTSTSEWCS